jgi:hypothetical protein
MVLVRMGEKNTGEIGALLLDETQVRENEIDAGFAVIGKGAWYCKSFTYSKIVGS